MEILAINITGLFIVGLNLESNLIKQGRCALTAAHHSLAWGKRRLADLCVVSAVVVFIM